MGSSHALVSPGMTLATVVRPRGPEVVAHDPAPSASDRPRLPRPYRAIVDDTPNSLIINTAEWASLLREQLAERGLTPLTAATPAGPVPAGVATIRRWLDNRAQVVSVEKILEVCRALGYPVPRALVRVGILRPEEVGVVGLAPTTPVLVPIVHRINGLLHNRRIPEAARDWLGELLEATVSFWAKSLGAPGTPERNATPAPARRR